MLKIRCNVESITRTLVPPYGRDKACCEKVAVELSPFDARNPLVSERPQFSGSSESFVLDGLTAEAAKVFTLGGCCTITIEAD